MKRMPGLILVVGGFVVSFLLTPRWAWARDVPQPQEGRDYVVVDRSSPTETVVRIMDDVNVDPVAFGQLFDTEPFAIRTANPTATLPLCKRVGDGSRAPKVRSRAERASNSFWDGCKTDGSERKAVYLVPGETLRMPRGKRDLSPDAKRELADKAIACGDDSACRTRVINEVRVANGLSPLKAEPSVQQSQPDSAPTDSPAAALAPVTPSTDAAAAIAVFEREAIVRTKWMILFGLILSTALLLVGLWTFELKLALREKDQEIADLNTAHSASFQALQGRLDVAEGDLRKSQGVVERVATKLGVPTQGQVVHDAVLRAVDVFASVMTCMREIADGCELQLSQFPTAVELQAVCDAIDAQALGLEDLRDYALRARRALGEDKLPSAQREGMSTRQVGEGLLKIAQQRRRDLAGLLGLTWSSEIPPAFKQIVAELNEKLELLRRLRQENEALSAANAALLVQRQACVDAETGILARLVNQVATMGEWLGAQVCPPVTCLADVPDRMRAANAAFGRAAIFLDRLFDQLGVVRPVEWRDLSKRPPTIADRLTLLGDSLLLQQQEIVAMWNGESPRGIVPWGQLNGDLRWRIDGYNGSLSAAAVTERENLARSLIGWRNSQPLPTLQELVRTAQTFARDARADQDKLSRAMTPNRPADWAHALLEVFGLRPDSPSTALRVILGCSEDSNVPPVSGVIDRVRQDSGAQRTLARWRAALVLEDVNALVA